MPTAFRPLLAALLIGVAMPAPAQDTQAPSAPGTQALAPIKDLPAKGDGIDPGAYLAARVAGSDNDYTAAADWFGQALAADPKNGALMEGDIVARIGAGDFASAIPVAARLAKLNPEAQVAQIALIADEAKRGDFATLLAAMKGNRAVSPLMDQLVTAWAELGTGDMSQAQKDFDKIAATKGLEAFGLYHKALALASVGDFEGAEKILAVKGDGPLKVLRRGRVANAEILSQLERNPEAIKVLTDAFPEGNDPSINGMIADLQAGKTLPFDVTRNVTDGLAEVFFTMALAATGGEASDAFTLIYARTAIYLRPNHAEAILLAAAMLENQQRWELADATYALVAPADPGFFAAELGRARALQSAGKTDAAEKVLATLAKSRPDLIGVYLAQGDLYRGEDRWADAEVAYDKAVARVKPGEPAYWSVYYSRAVALERQKKWAAAEKDFRTALSLSPDQPVVLNYLGYSYIERNENLDEALDMIRKAVAARPDSGFIIDSLAWGLFRLGRYADAVAPMEKASLLEPVDPVVTDHLGDVYWSVGRKLEAQFQWRRALSFDPDEKEAKRLRAKLDKGLDAVMKDEGVPPLKAVDAPKSGN